MRVVHVIPSVAERSGGPATAIIPMCRALMQQGIEVLLLSTADQEAVQEYKGVPAIFFPPQLGASFKYSRPLSSWLSSNIKNFDLAHIHAVFNHSSVAASHACRNAGVPYIIRPLGTLDPWSMAQKPLRKRLFWHLSAKGMLHRAAAVHYTSEVEKLSTERLLGLNHGKVVALGIDANNSNGKHASLFPQPYVLVLSRLHPKKGLDVLIEAFLSLIKSDRFAHWRLVLAGDGPSDYVSKLKTAASAQPDRIVFAGWLDEETKHVALSDSEANKQPVDRSIIYSKPDIRRSEESPEIFVSIVDHTKAVHDVHFQCSFNRNHYGLVIDDPYAFKGIFYGF